MEGFLAAPIAHVFRFVWGFALGVLGLGVVGLSLIAGSKVLSAVIDRVADDGTREASRLIIIGPTLADRKGVAFQFDSARLRVSLACHGACDDLVIAPGVSRPRVKLLDSSGECVACGRDLQWRSVAAGAVLVERPGRRDPGAGR